MSPYLDRYLHKWVLEKFDNYPAIIMAMGMPEEMAKAFNEMIGSTIEFTYEGDDRYGIHIRVDPINYVNTLYFRLGIQTKVSCPDRTEHPILITLLIGGVLTIEKVNPDMPEITLTTKCIISEDGNSALFVDKVKSFGALIAKATRSLTKSNLE